MTTYLCHRCDGLKTCKLIVKDGIKKTFHIPRPTLIPKPSCPAVTGKIPKM